MLVFHEVSHVPGFMETPGTAPVTPATPCNNLGGPIYTNEPGDVNVHPNGLNA